MMMASYRRPRRISRSTNLAQSSTIQRTGCFSSPEEAAKYIGTEVYIDRKDGQPLEEGEYYIADLIGCSVITEDGTNLGTVRDVLQTGANDVYVVGCGVPDAKGLKEKEILLPVIRDCIKKVDIEKGEILVHIMPGLLDQ